MKSNLISALALVAALAALGMPFIKGGADNRLAFVDTNRLMTAFTEAHKANNEIKVEDEKWRGNLKVMEDSLKSFMDTMTVRYDRAGVAEKRALQDELSMRNQQINNYTAAQAKKMEQAAQKRLATVYEKINSYMKEYGKTKGFHVIFGTASGSILYGEGTPMDITDEVIQGLNKRYE